MPRVEAPAVAAVVSVQPSTLGGSETILLVQDAEAVRVLAR